jgi:hypothetical protein
MLRHLPGIEVALLPVRATAGHRHPTSSSHPTPETTCLFHPLKLLVAKIVAQLPVRASACHCHAPFSHPTPEVNCVFYALS